jgi:SAM-dependent methyltransferase
MNELQMSAGAAAALAPADDVRTFYDEHIVEKVADFVDGNRRVEAAWAAIEQWAPAPGRILEIGCGFGHTSWRMARRWPGAQVTGFDISPRSIEYAAKVFARANLTFVAGRVDEIDRGSRGFDLIVLVDVYEHIAASARADFNAALGRLVSSNGGLILTFPTPAHLGLIRATTPEKLQPVDEDVHIETLLELAAATGTRLTMYSERSIWRSCDYAHAMFGRQATGCPLDLPAPAREPGVLGRVVRKVRRLSQPHDPASREARLALIERTLGTGVYRPRR